MIYVVTEIYYPEEISTGYILTRIAEGLAATTPVHVFTGPPDYSRKHDVSAFEVRNDVTIERIWAPSLNKNNLLFRILRVSMLSMKLGWKALTRVRRGTAVLVVTNPAPVLLVMAIICRLLRANMVILVHDVFPENLVAAGLIRRDSLGGRLLSHIFNAVYRGAAHVVTIGRDMQALMLKKTGRNPGEVSVIPNWADIEEITPLPRSQAKILDELGIRDNFVVQFAGNIGRVQGVEHIVEAAEILRSDNFHFLFIGNGAKRQWLEEQVALRGLTNVTVIGQLPRSRQVEFLNACDVSLVCLSPGMLGLGVPSKSYNILAAGKPIVAVTDPASEIALLVREENLGWVVPPGSPEDLATALREATVADLEEIGMKARDVAEKKYSLDAVVTSYQDIFGGFQ